MFRRFLRFLVLHIKVVFPLLCCCWFFAVANCTSQQQHSHSPAYHYYYCSICLCIFPCKHTRVAFCLDITDDDNLACFLHICFQVSVYFISSVLLLLLLLLYSYLWNVCLFLPWICTNWFFSCNFSFQFWVDLVRITNDCHVYEMFPLFPFCHFSFHSHLILVLVLLSLCQLNPSRHENPSFLYASLSRSLFIYYFFPHFTFWNAIYVVPCARSHVIAFLILFGSYLWVPNCIKKTYSNAYLVGFFSRFFISSLSAFFISFSPFYYLLSPSQFHFILFRFVQRFLFMCICDILLIYYALCVCFCLLLLFISNSTYETLQANNMTDYVFEKSLKIVMLHTHKHNTAQHSTAHGYSKTHCALASSSSSSTSASSQRKATKQ